MRTATVDWEDDSRGVMTIRLNRPRRHNAYDDKLVRDLGIAMEAAEASSTLRAVVIRGNGRHFQAGADLDWLDELRRSGNERNLEASIATMNVVHRLHQLAAPTIALVQGYCVGGGTGLVAACDIVIASNDARFAISEVRWGLTASIILPQLMDAMGSRQLRRYALTGERFDAWEACRLGLVHEVRSEGDMETRCEEILAMLLANEPYAIKETKAHILALASGTITECTKLHLAKSHAARRQTEQAKEGIASFQEKRAAKWGD